MPTLSVSEVREFIKDKPEFNHLLDGEEFSPVQINMSIELAIDHFNGEIPVSNYSNNDFPKKDLLMSGTLYKLMSGASALLARNHMSFSDGGLQIPVEERITLYQSLAEMYKVDFETRTQKWKINNNIETGWGSVATDQSLFPYF
jgi:hypothetical protein